MEAKLMVDNVKIGQMIKVTRTDGSTKDEGYYLGMTEMKLTGTVQDCIMIGYPAHFKEMVAPYREYDIPLHPVTMLIRGIVDIQIVEGDAMTAEECFLALVDFGFKYADIPKQLIEAFHEGTEEDDVS